MLAHNAFTSNMLTLPGLAASYRQRWHRLSLICTQGKLSGEDTHLLMKPSFCYSLSLSSCFTCFSPSSSGTGETAREQRSTKWSNKKTRLAGEVAGWLWAREDLSSNPNACVMSKTNICNSGSKRANAFIWSLHTHLHILMLVRTGTYTQNKCGLK